MALSKIPVICLRIPNKTHRLIFIYVKDVTRGSRLQPAPLLSGLNHINCHHPSVTIDLHRGSYIDLKLVVNTGVINIY